MKIKTFILTFLLMMMSSPIVFGQSRASVTTDVSNWEGLKEALTVINTGQDETEITVRLTADINIPADEAPIEILAGKNVTLNLNGYVIKAASTKYVFNNLGNLTIHDGSDEKNSAIEGRGIYNGRTTGDGQLINRNAKLTIQNGIFRSTSADGGAAIYNYGIADIQGGSFYAEYAAIANFGEMTINNARIIGENYAIDNDSTLTIGNTYYYGTIDTGDLTAEVNPAVYTVSPEGSVKPFEAYLYVKDFYYNTSEDYYKTVAEAVSKINIYPDTPKEATLTLLVNTEISNEILISNNVTVNLNNKKVTFKGGDQSRFKVTADVTFKNGTIEGPERCVYTYSAGKDVALNLENVNLTTTGTTGYQQPLTIAGTAEAETTTVDLKNVKIDAGNATGYGIISFVKTMLTADEDTEVSGYAALYAKDNSLGTTGSAGSEFVFNGSTLIGKGGKEGEANSFSTIALHESNVTVKMNGGVAKSLGGNHAILGIGWTDEPIETGNTIILDATMEVTGGSQYLYMANANTNTVVVRSEYVDPSWSTAAYGDLVQVKGIAVAKIGDVKYCSLAEAVEAAAADATIELINADVDESAATVTINKKLNLKGEGIDKYKFPQIKLEGTANVSVAGTSYHPTTFEYFNVTVGELAQFIVKGYSTVNGTFVNNGDITLNTATIGGNITNNKNIVVRNASDIIASQYSGNGTINLENVRMSATKLSGVGSVVATGTNDIVASTISARSFKVENEAVVNLNDNAYVNGITNGSTMTVNGTLNVNNSAVWYLNVNLAEASKLKVTGKHTISNPSIKDFEFKANTQMNVADGAEIFVASDAVLTAKKAVVAEGAEVALNFYANVTFTETVNNGTINLYLNEGKTFTTPEITEGLNVETEYGCIVSYENNAYEAIRILNEGDVAVIAETGIGYETLQDAINAVQDGQVIKLIKDIKYIDYVYASEKTTAVNIANNKQFTLDLNGFTIYGENSTTGNYELITIAQGTQLTIDDLSADKKGKISYKGTRTTADGWMKRCHTIFNQGSLIVNNGLIENITPVEAEAVASAIDNNASWGKLGHLTFNGGTVKSTSYYAVRTDVNTHNTTATSDNVAKTVFNGGEVYGFYLMDRGSDQYSSTQNPNNIDIDITENATIKPCEYNGQALRFVFNNKSPYDVEISEEAEINGTIKGIDAKIGNKYYPLQGAIDAVPAVADAETTIEFIHDITSDATVSQAENKNITIDGKEFNYSGTIYIHGNARYTGAETLTIQNVNFTTEEASHDFISSNSTGAVERYAHNVTVKDCDFTSTYTGEEKNEVVAMRFRQAYNINVIGGEFTNLHSVMQANGNTGTNFEGVKANCIEGVFSMTGGAGSFSIKDSEFTSQGYGIRVGEGYNKNFNIEGCTITAPVPVAVRYAENGGPLYFTFGQNTMNSDNPYNYWFVAGTGKDEYDGGETLPEIGGQVVVNIDEDSTLAYEGVYGNYYVVKIEDTQYPSLAAALAAVENGQIIEIVRPNVGKEAAIDYPAADATDYATEFTITGGEGYQFSGITFRGDVNVTFDNAIIKTSLYALEDATINFNGNNKVNAILGTKDGKIHYNVNDGSFLDMTYGKLHANVNVYGNSNISFAEVGDAAYGNNIYMYGVTLDENTAINGANVLFVEGENTLNGATIKANDFDVNQGVTVNVEGNSSIKSSLTEGFSDINGTLNVVNAEEVYFTRLNISSEGSIVNANTNSTMVIGTISNETTGKINLAQNVVVRHADGGNSIRHFAAQDWDHEVYYEEGYYKVREIKFNFCINNVHDRSYLTFEEALANVQNGETIHITTGATGDEHSVEIDYNEEIEFTITGEAPDYKLPTVTFQNTTVNIVNSNITIAELDARQNATINVEDSDVKTCGNGSADGIAKSYFNGRIVIDNSTVYAHQATTMGYIDIINGGKLNVTWQTNVYGNGLITVEGEKETDPQVKSTLQTAAFNLTGQPYNDRDNTDEDRVGKPATVVVDGAVLIAGDVTNNNGANYSYEVDSYGINIGTIEGKAALLDIKNGSSVEFAMNPTGNHSFKSPVIGANGTVNIDASTLVVKNRIANSTDICKLQNNGVVYVTGASDINASVEGAGWFYMNGVTMSNETQLLGAKVRFASGTNNLVGSTIDDGYFQVGIGAYEGVDENVDTDNGVIVNVSDNANVGASGTTYAGWIGTGFYDTDAKKAAAMTEGVKYVLNINNSIAEFGYFHVSNDGELNVNGNAANKVGYNTSSYTFYAGNFIINGTAEFKETDVLALYTKVSCDNGTDKPGTLNIINTEYEAERHNGAVEGINFDVRKTGVVNVQGADTELYLNEYTSIAKDAKFDVKENANVTALGTITNNGTINVLAGTMTTGTAQIAAINNTSTGAITVAQGSTLDANTNITNRGKLIVNGTLNADANLYAYDNAEAELTVNGTLTQPQNGDISISLTHNSNYNNLKGNYNFGKNAVVNVNKITSSHSKMLLNIGNGAQVTAKSMNLSGSIKAISPAFIKVEDDIVCYNTITIENANLDYRTQLKSVDESYGIIFEGTNNLTNAILTDSKVTVNSGATLTVSAGSYYNNNNINVASLTNNGTLIVGNYANVNVTNTVSNKATAIVNGTLTAATLNNNSYNKTLTVNGTLTATTSLYNAANATINGSGNIKADASTVIELTNDGEIEGDLTISAKTIYNYNKIDVAEIVATDFYNTNMTYSSVIVDDATLQSVSFTNSGTVNVTGEFSKVLITNEVTGTGQFVMEGVNLTSGNTMLHGAYIVFNEENSATGLTFGSDINNSITVNGTLNIFGDVIAKGLGICGEVGAKVVLNENSTLTAHSGLKLYPEADPFVTPYDKDYHVVESPAENSKSVYSLNPNSDYVAMVKNDEDYDTGIFYETVQGAIDAAVDGNTIEILKSTIDESEIKVVGKKLTFKSDNGIVVNGTFTAQAEVTFKHAVQFEKLYVNATDARLIIENGAAVTVTGATIMSLTSRIVLRGDARFYTTDSTLDKVISESDDYRAIYDAAGKYYYLVSSYVAEVGGVEYPTLQEAIDNATVEAKVITLLAKYGQPIPMNACVEGKEVTITTNNEEIDVDWSKGSLFVGRHADNTISGGDATLKFENANLVSTSFETLHSNGLNISGRHKDGHAYNGTVNVVNSTIEVDYILVRNAMNIENSKVVVKGDNGYTTPAGSKCNVLIGGRPDNETTTQDHATAKLNLVNSTLEVENHIRTNYEGRGEMDIDATSTVVAESIYAPRLSKVNSEGNIFAHLEEQIANLIVLKGGVYTEDVNAFCATGYSAYPCEYETEYPFTSFWAVRESHGSQTIKLVGKTSEGTGWNYVSSYMKNFDLTDLQNGIVEGGVTTAQIWSQADGIRSLTSNGWTGANNLTVSPAQMYKIYVDKDANVTLQEGDYVDYGTYEMTLEHGWNWIGYPVTKSMMVSDAFEIVKDGEVIIFPSEYDEIKDNQGHSAYFEDGVWYDDFELVPGRGYMYLHNGEEAITFTYPNEVTVPSTTPQRETKYWNAPVGFASTMTMVAMVNIDGEFVDGNYEVAAFANGELRGSARPIYVESRNAYYLLMSIGGSKVEELTFKYYDVNYGTEYELDNRINFTSDVRLGSFDEPYVLTMNITDIEEVTLSDINIYPNPTTTGVQVNLDATCEKVEIFNALGVKVAEYQNVDSIDAFETAGIYVIRLTNGGEIKHTRLVVK